MQLRIISYVAVQGELQIVVGAVFTGVLVVERKTGGELAGKKITGIAAAAALLNVYDLGFGDLRKCKKTKQQQTGRSEKKKTHIQV